MDRLKKNWKGWQLVLLKLVSLRVFPISFYRSSMSDIMLGRHMFVDTKLWLISNFWSFIANAIWSCVDAIAPVRKMQKWIWKWPMRLWTIPFEPSGMGHFPLENTVCSLLTEQKPKCCWGENYHSKENLPPTRER